MDELNTVLAKIGGWKSVFFALALIGAVVVLRKLLAAPPAARNDTRKVRCTCGWQGSVTRHKPRCPMCARSDQLADV